MYIDQLKPIPLAVSDPWEHIPVAPLQAKKEESADSSQNWDGINATKAEVKDEVDVNAPFKPHATR